MRSRVETATEVGVDEVDAGIGVANEQLAGGGRGDGVGGDGLENGEVAVLGDLDGGLGCW